MKEKRGKMSINSIQTPCYVLHEEELLKGIDLLKKSLNQYWKYSEIGYSFKTNSLPWLLKTVKEQGFFAEVVSEDEYHLALFMGFENIIYNGPVKGKDSFYDALKRDTVIVNLDGKEELKWLKESKECKAKIGLRVNFDLESLLPGQTSAGKEGSRFGFSIETGEFEQAVNELESIGIKLSGIHLHVSSKTRSVEIYRNLAKKACELKRSLHLNIDYVDIGGGYFGGLPNKPKFPDYLQVIKEEIKKEFSEKETMLIVEPGTSLVSSPFEYVTTVLDTKNTYANHVVITDGSRIDVDPRFLKKEYFYKIQYKDSNTMKRNNLEKQIVSGFTCMEDDRLFEIKDSFQLEVGDRISYQNVGAYTMCLTPLFIRYFPRVYLEQDGKYQLIRSKWNEEEYCQKSIVK